MAAAIPNPGPNLVDRRECPVCFTALVTPVFQCFNGHLICETCLSKINQCPVCREDYPERKIRARGFEDLLAVFLISCRYHMYGCEFRSYPLEIGNHESTCSFKHVTCPLLDGSCETIVREKDLLKHLKSVHKMTGVQDYKLGSYLEITQDCSLDEIRTGSVQILSHFIVLDRKIKLYVRTHISPDGRFMGWAVTLENSEEPGATTGLISVIKLIGPTSTSSGRLHCKWSGPINQNEKMNFTMTDKNCLIVPIQLLELCSQQIFEGHHVFKIMVKIAKVNVRKGERRRVERLESTTKCLAEPKVKAGNYTATLNGLAGLTLDTRFNDVKSVSAVSGAPPLPSLRFHKSHGPGVLLSNDDKQAKAVNQRIHVIVFTDRPIKMNEKVSVRMTGHNRWNLIPPVVGFTNRDPRNLYLVNLDKYLYEGVQDDFIKTSLLFHMTTNVVRKLVFSFSLDQEGQVTAQVDGKPMDVVNYGTTVNVSLPFWAFFIFGHPVQLDLTHPFYQIVADCSGHSKKM